MTWYVARIPTRRLHQALMRSIQMLAYSTRIPLSTLLLCYWAPGCISLLSLPMYDICMIRTCILIHLCLWKLINSDWTGRAICGRAGAFEQPPKWVTSVENRPRSVGRNVRLRSKFYRPTKRDSPVGFRPAGSVDFRPTLPPSPGRRSDRDPRSKFDQFFFYSADTVRVSR